MDSDLPLLLRHYAAHSPSSPALIPSPPFPSSHDLSLPSTQQWLVDNLLATHRVAHEEDTEGARSWKKVFWRRVVKGIEAGFDERRTRGDEQVADEEVHPDILEAMVDLLSTPGSSSGSAAPGVSTRTYYWGELRKPRSELNALKTREEGRMISGGTTGLRTWQACIALANHFLADPSPLLRSRRTVELGSGIGLLSLVAAKLHADAADSPAEVAARIVATDVDEKVLDMLQGNVELNRLQHFVGALKLDWELTADLAKNGEELAQWEQQAFPHGGRADLILGADIVYDPSLAGHLASTLAWLLSPRTGDTNSRHCEALIAGTIRNESTWELFLHECRTRQLKVEPLGLKAPPNWSGLVGAEGWEGEGEVRLVRITQ
ncbi:hypothetical protein JCM5296_002520 [Sporobolomyces johnsonii]